MGELEDMINSVLSDPQQMSMINELAKTLAGGQEQKRDQGPAFSGISELFSGGGKNGGADIDPAFIMRIGRALSAGNDGGDKKALLEAMKPYLSEKRRAKMDRAMGIARLARIARIAMDGMGGGNV